MQAYVGGVSTRSVDDLVAVLGAESGILKSEVSRSSSPGGMFTILPNHAVGFPRTHVVGSANHGEPNSNLQGCCSLLAATR